MFGDFGYYTSIKGKCVYLYTFQIDPKTLVYMITWTVI